MEQSEKAKQFLDVLDSSQLQVGDGSDHLPIWIGVDAQAGRVYKVYATGLAQGFGDGCLSIISGLRVGCDDGRQKIEQTTRGRVMTLRTKDKMYCYECDPQPVLKPLFEPNPLDDHGGSSNAVAIPA